MKRKSQSRRTRKPVSRVPEATVSSRKPTLNRSQAASHRPLGPCQSRTPTSTNKPQGKSSSSFAKTQDLKNRRLVLCSGKRVQVRTADRKGGGPRYGQYCR